MEEALAAYERRGPSLVDEQLLADVRELLSGQRAAETQACRRPPSPPRDSALASELKAGPANPAQATATFRAAMEAAKTAKAMGKLVHDAAAVRAGGHGPPVDHEAMEWGLGVLNQQEAAEERHRKHGPGPPGAVGRPWRFPLQIDFVWHSCMGAPGA